MRQALRGLVVGTVLALAGCGGEDSEPPANTTAPAAESSRPAVPVAVSPPVELLSVLFRMAGAPPYERAATPYAAAADRHFARSRSHPAVAATAALTRERGISYDAPMQLAAYLGDDLRPTRSLRPLPPGFDARWRGVDVEAYARQLRSFAQSSGFKAFLAGQSGYHRKVEAAYGDLLTEQSVLEWFDQQFGPRRGASVRVVPGLLTGGFGFSATSTGADGRMTVMPVAYLDSPDAEGVPHPTARSLETLVHEIAHSYVNPIFTPRAAAMRAAAEPLFERNAQAMRQQAYASYPIMVNESVVRAMTVLFLRDRISKQAAEASLAEQRKLSFTWTPELAGALADARKPLPPEALVRITQDVLNAAR